MLGDFFYIFFFSFFFFSISAQYLRDDIWYRFIINYEHWELIFEASDLLNKLISAAVAFSGFIFCLIVMFNCLIL